MKFKIEQVAFCPTDPEAAIELLEAMGMTEWVHDTVNASGTVFSNEGSNVADLAFNYQALDEAKELEILHYTNGPNWMFGNTPSASHIGMHVTEEELDQWKAFFWDRGIAIAQEVYTTTHTNPFLLENGRKYHYCIFDTRSILGLDVKFIVRREP